MTLINNFYVKLITNPLFPSPARGKWHYTNIVGSYTEAVCIRPLKKSVGDPKLKLSS